MFYHCQSSYADVSGAGNLVPATQPDQQDRELAPLARPRLPEHGESLPAVELPSLFPSLSLPLPSHCSPHLPRCLNLPAVVFPITSTSTLAPPSPHLALDLPSLSCVLNALLPPPRCAAPSHSRSQENQQPDQSCCLWQALNNVTEITGLERNEKLRKLDLTVNFIDLEGLLTIERLRFFSSSSSRLSSHSCSCFPPIPISPALSSEPLTLRANRQRQPPAGGALHGRKPLCGVPGQLLPTRVRYAVQAHRAMQFAELTWRSVLCALRTDLKV